MQMEMAKEIENTKPKYLVFVNMHPSGLQTGNRFCVETLNHLIRFRA